MKSIQTKFITLILCCVLLSAAVIGGAGIAKAQQVVGKDSAQILNLLCSERAGELNGLLSRIEQSVKTLAVFSQEQLWDWERLKTDAPYRADYTRRLESVAANTANNTEGALAVYVRFNPDYAPPTSGLFWSRTALSGRFQPLTPTDFSQYNPADVEHVGWYYIPVQNGRATWMAPYDNQNIHVKMISYVIPIYHNAETVGVVGMDIDYGVVQEAVNATRVFKSGYAFLTDEQGNIMHHRSIPMGTFMGTADSSLLPVVTELNNGTSGSALFQYTWQGQEKKMAFRTLNNGMRLVVTAPLEEIDAERNELIVQSAVALVLIAALSIVLTVYLTRRLIRPLKELNEAAKRIAGGDLSVSISPQTRDEVGALADSFRQTVSHLQQYITYINGLAYRDSLTGVKNKTAYQDAVGRLEEQMRAGLPEFGLVVLDINGLKRINDRYGHDFGDMLIIEACKIICRTFKHSPVYRIGGDEFVVLLENGDLARYVSLLEEFERNMEEHNRLARPDSHLSVARGIAVYDHETDLVFANVFKRADDAMYKNKAASKKDRGANA